ncbi:Ryanodine receptor 44F [Toxocara canis]|uniref:Ryanodine receptor 44F n=1 Tax=Toxocara canis TaxID=6265 RepID=A0A0B2W0G0_TOXCA|nr:Ryanodine receptor 44F [Toxocara canis]
MVLQPLNRAKIKDVYAVLCMHVRKDKHANSIVIACLKRLLPVGLNVFGGRELDIVQQTKEKFLAKESEEKIREFVRSLLDIPVKTDPTDKNAWQLNLYRKIGKSQMRGKEEMTQDAVVEKIINMGHWRSKHPRKTQS